ncbi:male-specific lethal 1 homolog [Armigeres subalbatus]|uniref:male-specific lethal 1 homolog n=1 Tax=Armigeres subalbatus TaxID=124917 RepID=UPI002ED5C3B8
MMMENLDHVYCNTASADVGSKDSSEQMSLFKEVKQLQSILLLHLDLIQEQSDQILAKDKMIIKLKDENEMLKHQLELVNKRLQQMKHQKEQREIGIPIRNVTVDKVYEYNNRVISSVVPEPAPREQLSDATNAVKIIKKEVISNDYDSFDVICQDFSGELESDIKIENNEIEEEIFLNYSKSDDESVPSNEPPIVETIPPVESRPNSCSTPISYGVISSQPLKNIKSENKGQSVKSSDSEDIVNNLQQSEEDPASKTEVIVINDDPIKSSLYNPVCSSGNSSDGSSVRKSCKFMMTSKPYITCNWKDEAITNDLDRLLENEAAELEVPCWTVIEDNYECLSSPSELTSENISEEVYLKRHAKFEIDERRRKKWDVQRIREQKNIERLKKRHLKADSDCEQKNIGSFFPSVESIKYVQITEDIPVQAFGELIPILPTSSFSLPWMAAHIDTTSINNVTPSELGPGPLFSAATGIPTTTTSGASCSTSQEQKTKFMHRLGPNLNIQKQRFTKRIKKEN